ncbi:MAG: M20/M25/M40 family metallo-hydrolase [Thermoanaerobaculia bacterium]
MRKLILLLALLLSVAAFAAEPATTPALSPEAARYKADIEVLASDAMEGRGLNTAGIEKAAAWIEARMQKIGLAPAFGKSYRQPVKIKTGVTLLDGNRVEGLAEGDWTPLGFSSPGDFAGEIAFVGYGIESEPLKFRELEGVDLKGKVALMLRYEPQERDEKSVFDGRKPSRWSAVRYRVHQAKQRGAVAVVFVTGPLQDEGKDKLPVLRNDGPESPAGLPVIQVKTSVAQKWLTAAGIDLKKFQEDVDKDLTPRSVASTGVKASGKIALEASYADTANVAGIIPGKGALAKEYVVLGAHYDHLGMGGERSMKPNVPGVHNGADDNASGSVAVLHAAETLVKQLARSKNHRSIVVALFSGEEVGLAGSAHFVANSPVPANKIVAMLNLDMVGTLRENALAALGADSGDQWKEAIEASGKAVGLKVTAGGDGYGPSDQTSFYAAQIPVVHFFTGTTDTYHTSDDDAERINFEGGARVSALTAHLANEIAAGRVTPKYTRVAATPSEQGDSRGYGAYLGTVPDYTAMAETSGGVLISDVRAGGPADLAGIKGGDRLVELAGTKIENLYDMTFALQDNKPGETVDVVILRGGERVKLRATLGERKDRGGAPKSPHGGTEPKKPEMPMPPAEPKG